MITPLATRASLVAAMLAVLTACVPVEPLPGPGPVPPQDGVNACGALDLQYLVGQPASVLETMRFSQPVRVIRPGMAVTMDYSAARLNFSVDRSGYISRVYCG
ncbi:MAG: I78 family peptidase inhibitor [Pseudomonadota bacterium]